MKSRKQSVRAAVRQASAALDQIAKAIENLEARLGTLAAVRGGSVARAARRTRRISPAGRRFLKQQGRYLGLVRHLSARKKAQVMAIRARRGYGPAIREAVRLSAR